MNIVTVVIITTSLSFSTSPIRFLEFGSGPQVQKVLDVNKNGLLSTTEFSPNPQQLASFC